MEESRGVKGRGLPSTPEGFGYPVGLDKDSKSNIYMYVYIVKAGIFFP